MTPQEARRRFAAGSVARLATVGPDGGPHVVPITFAVDDDRIVTAVDAKPKRAATLRRIVNVRADPRVSVLVDHYAADWTQLWWARADGRARIVEDGDDFEDARRLLRLRYPQYTATALDGPAIVIEVERWSGWAADELGDADPLARRMRG